MVLHKFHRATQYPTVYRQYTEAPLQYTELPLQYTESPLQYATMASITHLSTFNALTFLIQLINLGSKVLEVWNNKLSSEGHLNQWHVTRNRPGRKVSRNKSRNKSPSKPAKGFSDIIVGAHDTEAVLPIEFLMIEHPSNAHALWGPWSKIN